MILRLPAAPGPPVTPGGFKDKKQSVTMSLLWGHTGQEVPAGVLSSQLRRLQRAGSKLMGLGAVIAKGSLWLDC